MLACSLATLKDVFFYLCLNGPRSSEASGAHYGLLPVLSLPGLHFSSPQMSHGGAINHDMSGSPSNKLTPALNNLTVSNRPLYDAHRGSSQF